MTPLWCCTSCAAVASLRLPALPALGTQPATPTSNLRSATPLCWATKFHVSTLLQRHVLSASIGLVLQVVWRQAGSSMRDHHLADKGLVLRHKSTQIEHYGCRQGRAGAGDLQAAAEQVWCEARAVPDWAHQDLLQSWRLGAAGRLGHTHQQVRSSAFCSSSLP